MAAYADRGYIVAQLAAAKAAGERLLVAASKVFGRRRAKAILKRVKSRPLLPYVIKERLK